MTNITFCVCTYNRGDNLKRLLPEMLRQSCVKPFEVLVVDNNSTDNTSDVVQNIAKNESRLRYVFEPKQGIVPARNRAIEESLSHDYLVFIDDDELPKDGFLQAALDGLESEGADCVGGKIEVDFDGLKRPWWLNKELMGFLAEIDYSDVPFWNTDKSRPLWTANIGYKTSLFVDDPTLRFDLRFNREGDQLGGGEDAAMFWSLVDQGKKIRYRPDMITRHFVEAKRIRISYFLGLHFEAGRKFGYHRMGFYPRTLRGIPYFLFPQLMGHIFKIFVVLVKPDASFVRQTMNVAHCMGMMKGAYQRVNHCVHV